MSNRQILVVVAHSDDETIGMGGAIRRHVDRGDKVSIVSMTDGISARAGASQSDLEQREASAKRAADILGFRWEKPYA